MKAGHDPADMDYEADDLHAQRATEAYEKITKAIRSREGGLRAYFFETGSMTLKSILKQDVDAQRQDTSAATVGLEAMLAAIVTGAYAALETMAEDLWIEAANRHDSLGMNWISHNKRKFDSDVFTTYGPNFSGRFETFLTETRKVQFQCMNDIKNT